MHTPDITKAQVVAVAQAVIGAAVAFGAPVSEAQSISLMGLVATIAAVLFHSDAKIRAARADAHAKVEQAKVILPDGIGE